MFYLLCQVYQLPYQILIKSKIFMTKSNLYIQYPTYNQCNTPHSIYRRQSQQVCCPAISNNVDVRILFPITWMLYNSGAISSLQQWSYSRFSNSGPQYIDGCKKKFAKYKNRGNQITRFSCPQYHTPSVCTLQRNSTMSAKIKFYTGPG